jgi:hypothetical protein
MELGSIFIQEVEIFFKSNKHPILDRLHYKMISTQYHFLFPFLFLFTLSFEILMNTVCLAYYSV